MQRMKTLRRVGRRCRACKGRESCFVTVLQRLKGEDGATEEEGRWWRRVPGCSRSSRRLVTCAAEANAAAAEHGTARRRCGCHRFLRAEAGSSGGGGSSLVQQCGSSRHAAATNRGVE